MRTERELILYSLFEQNQLTIWHLMNNSVPADIKLKQSFCILYFLEKCLCVLLLEKMY